MKSGLLSLLFLLIVSLSLTGSASAARTKLYRETTFIVRKPDKVKHIADRFHVKMKVIHKLNPRLHGWQTLYQGSSILIPVWYKKKTQQGSDDFNIADYTLDTDSLDDYIREDFVSMTDIEVDTMRRIAIDKEIKVLNRKVVILNAMLDSIEADAMQGVSDKEVKKMEIARQKYIGKFAMGTEIDNLVKQKQKLNEEKSKINIRVADYEYLIENAAYAARHHEQDDSKPLDFGTEWGTEPNTTKPIDKKGK